VYLKGVPQLYHFQYFQHSMYSNVGCDLNYGKYAIGNLYTFHMWFLGIMISTNVLDYISVGVVHLSQSHP